MIDPIGLGGNTALFVALVTLWTLPWTGWALWLAARRYEKWWFIAMLVLNTFAILEIYYIFFVAKRSDGTDEEEYDEEATGDDEGLSSDPAPPRA